MSETIRSFAPARATPSIALDFSPHKGAYTYSIGETTVEFANTYYANINEVITFTATLTFPTPDRYAVGYHWSFGDGSEGFANPATHTYKQTSVNIDVAFTVTDNKGVEWTARKSMYLK